MTPITINRAVVEQALEALKNNAGEMRVEGAISILETALAQQAEPRDQCGETCERAKLCATCAQALAQQDEPVEPVAWYRPSIAPDYYAPVFVEGAQPPAPLTQAEARLLGWRPLVPPKAEPVGRCEDCGMKYCECGERR